MPYIHTKTTASLGKTEEENIKAKLGKAIEIFPGKTEQWLMVSFEENCSLYFKGQSTEPMAFIEVALFGKASEQVYSNMTAELCKIYHEELNIHPDHIYIKYEEVDHWGWNGKNF